LAHIGATFWSNILGDMARKFGWLLLATALAVPGVASAQTGAASAGAGGAGASGAAAPLTEDQARAQKHFQRARELYSAGSYRDAITELEAARALDPQAKELVFNLGIVHEKLARFDEAIGYFQKYMEMDGVTPAERAKAESIIKRIEGAKREAQVSGGAAPPGGPPGPTEGLAGGDGNGPRRDAPPPRGRIDAATITAGSVAAVGLGVGLAFGVRAVALRPGDGQFVTGRDGTYADLAQKTQDAHDSAIVADVGLAIGLVGAAATALLYFVRTREPAPASAPTPEPGPPAASGPTPASARAKEAARTRVRIAPSAAPLSGGFAFAAVGTF
jgi:tetratricopeptide (TPR) repeat protein